MVWPFSSGSSGNSDSSSFTSTLDSLEKAGQDAKVLFQSTKDSIEDIATSASPKTSIAMQHLTSPSVEPYLIATAVFGTVTAAVVFYRARLRRIPTTGYLTPNLLNGRRVLRGKAVSVGDADNFRFYHTPGGVWAGWGWLRHVPTASKELKDQTMHIRLAGVDAPECAHFGMPAQPFSQEALEWLRKQVKGKTVLVKPLSKDRYDRVVSMAWSPRRFPFLPKKNVSEEILKVGLAQVYRQAGSEYDGMLERFNKLEAKATAQKVGIWSQKNMVSTAEHKRKYLRDGGESKASKQ